MRQSGFTLLEVLVAAAIAVTIAAAAFLTLGAHPFAAQSAATQFDSAFAYARALAAASGNGATLLAFPSATGTTLTVYSGRPTALAALTPAPMPPEDLPAPVSEIHAGTAPLAIFLDGAGHGTVAAYSGATPAPMAEPSCPPEGFWSLIIGSSGRRLACRRPVAG